MLDHTPIDIDKLYYSIGIDVQYYNMLPFGSLSTIHWAHLDLVVFKTLRHVYESALYCTKCAKAENKCRFKASCSCFLLNYPVKIRDYWHTSLLNAPIIMMKHCIDNNDPIWRRTFSPRRSFWYKRGPSWKHSDAEEKTFWFFQETVSQIFIRCCNVVVL